jgi:hypothetical protein
VLRHRNKGGTPVDPGSTVELANQASVHWKRVQLEERAVFDADDGSSVTPDAECRSQVAGLDQDGHVCASALHSLREAAWVPKDCPTAGQLELEIPNAQRVEPVSEGSLLQNEDDRRISAM